MNFNWTTRWRIIHKCTTSPWGGAGLTWPLGHTHTHTHTPQFWPPTLPSVWNSPGGTHTHTHTHTPQFWPPTHTHTHTHTHPNSSLQHHLQSETPLGGLKFCRKITLDEEGTLCPPCPSGQSAHRTPNSRTPERCWGREQRAHWAESTVHAVPGPGSHRATAWGAGCGPTPAAWGPLRATPSSTPLGAPGDRRSSGPGPTTAQPNNGFQKEETILAPRSQGTGEDRGTQSASRPFRSAGHRNSVNAVVITRPLTGWAPQK